MKKKLMSIACSALFVCGCQSNESPKATKMSEPQKAKEQPVNNCGRCSSENEKGQAQQEAEKIATPVEVKPTAPQEAQTVQVPAPQVTESATTPQVKVEGKTE